jgi:hypothetical protein
MLEAAWFGKRRLSVRRDRSFQLSVVVLCYIVLICAKLCETASGFEWSLKLFTPFS